MSLSFLSDLVLGTCWPLLGPVTFLVLICNEYSIVTDTVSRDRKAYRVIALVPTPCSW